MQKRRTPIECLEFMINIAQQNGAKLLDKDWNGLRFKYSFLLSTGDVIKKTAQAVKKSGLTLKPSFNENEAFKYIKNLANLNNAQLLDTQWKGATSSYSFNLNNEVFFISYSSIIKNGWPKDLKKFKKYSETIQKSDNDFYQELVDFATKYNGKVLTPNWLGNKTLHQFITEDGIIFEKKPINIKRSGWHK